MSPSGFELNVIRAALSELAGVAGVHDLHLWSVAGDVAILTAHVLSAKGSDSESTRRAVVELLGTRCKVNHSAIKSEMDFCGDEIRSARKVSRIGRNRLFSAPPLGFVLAS